MTVPLSFAVDGTSFWPRYCAGGGSAWAVRSLATNATDTDTDTAATNAQEIIRIEGTSQCGRLMPTSIGHAGYWHRHAILQTGLGDSCRSSIVAPWWR
jgi:hypothetical protein